MSKSKSFSCDSYTRCDVECNHKGKSVPTLRLSALCIENAVQLLLLK